MTIWLPDAHPLQWPDGWARTPMHLRKKSRYSVIPSKALVNLKKSVRLLGGDAAIMSSNLKIGYRGVAKMDDTRLLGDPGVAIHWVRGGKTEVMACDRWRHPWENMQAIYKALEGLRSMERAGATQIVERAFHAFSLPAGDDAKDWRKILGFQASFTPGRLYLKRVVRDKLRDLHPDRGGDEVEFKRVEEAGRAAEMELQD